MTRGIEVGIPQGLVLRSFLFNIYMMNIPILDSSPLNRSNCSILHSGISPQQKIQHYIQEASGRPEENHNIVHKVENKNKYREDRRSILCQRAYKSLHCTINIEERRIPGNELRLTPSYLTFTRWIYQNQIIINCKSTTVVCILNLLISKINAQNA